MAKDDDRPSRFSGTAGLVFAYVCFALSIGTIAAAIYLLPATLKVKLFLAAGAALLTSMFGFLAVAASIVMRGHGRSRPAAAAKPNLDPRWASGDDPGPAGSARPDTGFSRRSTRNDDR